MLTWLILHTLTALALALVVLALGRCLRLGPAARHALWLVVLLKLLMPPVLSWPWTLPAAAQPWASAAVAPRAEERQHPPPTFTFRQIDDRPLSPAGEWVILSTAWPQEAQPELVEGARGGGWKDRASLLAAAWLACGLFLAGRELVRARRLGRLLACARPASAELAAAVRELAGGLGVRPPRVLVLPALGSPMVWAWGPARLLWPAGLEEGLSPEAWRAVLVHELAHLRRRDHWAGWLLLVAGWAWWWHPLFWLVRRRLHGEAELACDAWVVATLPQARRAYAEALLTVCQRWSLPAAAAPALGAAGGYRDLERRLLMVMREQVPCRLSTGVILVVGALALAALPALTSGQSAPTAVPVQPAVTPTPATVPVPATQPPAADREARIKELEEKLQALQRELRALRGDAKPLTATVRPVPAPAARPATVAPYVLTPATTTVRVNPAMVVDAVTGAEAGGPVSEVTLTRATYKLKGHQAEALGKFLSDNVKASVLETKVDGENLIVTTTPEVQHVVTQVIALMQGKPLAGGTFRFHYSVPLGAQAK
jgi:beta-lactamase regulating signal transducer with metallopeptidase domain